jgi:penicillin amidase
MQLDTVDLSTKGILSALKTLQGKKTTQRAAINYINDWSGDMNKESIAATIFYVWMEHLRKNMFADEFKGFWNRSQEEEQLDRLIADSDNYKIYQALTEKSLDWCDDKRSEIVESCEDVMIQSLDGAIKQLVKLRGANMENWSWGEVHSSVFSHMPFSQSKTLSGLFELRVDSGGGPNSINVANADFVPSEGYEQSFGAGFRQIMQVGSERKLHYYINSTGQSGQVLSKHYSDMLELYSSSKFLELSELSLKQSVLVLHPQKNGTN